MILDFLGQAFVALTVFSCLILALRILGMIYLLWLHLILRREGIAAEALLLAHPLPRDDELPHVVVQIPVFNEGAIVERGIASAARLDWPKDRLHIQICDDSTDGTTELARAAARQAAETGVDIVVLHRDDRSDFKAGALRAAMAATPYDYFAILDVDYIPTADFLRRCMAALTSKSNLAFVQARPDFLNRDENTLTRAQAIILDYHYGLQQTTRSWSNQLLPFNGTCGIWRRAAIESGGEWRGDTLSEDWDLSYRVILKGWRGVFLATVPVPGELPTQLSAWITQQKRWAAGIGEVSKKVLPALLFDRNLSPKERWNTFFSLGTWLGDAMFPATFFCALVAMLLMPSAALVLGLTVYTVFAAAAIALFALMLVANRFLRRMTPLTSFALDFVTALGLLIYIIWANFQSLPATLVGRRRVFMRTPKEGSPVSAGRGSQ
jgi:cellulose synthase/poly-beta-1,6-N-acetylglucosamine synthase-like glycosyltransferase